MDGPPPDCNGLYVSEVKLALASQPHRPNRPRPDVVARATVVLNGQFVVRSVELIQRGEFRRLEMPRFGMKDACYPCTAELRAAMEAAAFGELDRVLAGKAVAT